MGARTEEEMVENEQEVCVRIRNLHKTYLLGIEGVPALRVSTLTPIWRVRCLLGKSGSGKATLLNLMGTIDQPTRGELEICGLKIRSRMEDKLLANLRLQRRFVFQTFNQSLNDGLRERSTSTILKNGRSIPDAHARGMSLLQQVGMGDRVNHYPSQLSGGNSNE